MRKPILFLILTFFIFSCQNLPNEIVEQPVIDLSKNHELGSPEYTKDMMADPTAYFLNLIAYFSAWGEIPDIMDTSNEPQTPTSQFYDLKFVKGGVVREDYEETKDVIDLHFLIGFWTGVFPEAKDGGEGGHLNPNQAKRGYGIEITNAQKDKFLILYYNAGNLNIITIPSITTIDTINFHNFIIFKNGVPRYRYGVFSGGWTEYYPEDSVYPWKATGQSYCYDGNTMAVSNSEGNFLRFILPSLISYGLNNTCADDLNLKPGEPFKIRALATTNPHEGSFEVLDEIIYTGKWNF